MKEISFDRAFQNYNSAEPVVLEFHIKYVKDEEKLFCRLTATQALVLSGMLLTYAAEHIEME
jgi:hypothetical protein